MRVPYRKLDAFAENGSRGNPAAYLRLSAPLTDAQYLAVAKEHKGFISEFVFALPSETAACELVYYSSECEVDFCGHGTIATMVGLLTEDERLRAMPTLTVDTRRKGRLTVYNRMATESAAYIAAPEAVALPVPADKGEIASALGVSTSALADAPVALIDAGLRTLLVPVRTLADEIRMRPDEPTLKAFSLAKGYDITLTYCRETADSGCIAHTRVFAPKFGYLEDPATGSGNSALANLLLQAGAWNGAPAKVEQGGAGERYNIVRIAAEDGKVLFGGGATARIVGEYLL